MNTITTRDPDPQPSPGVHPNARSMLQCALWSIILTVLLSCDINFVRTFLISHRGPGPGGALGLSQKISKNPKRFSRNVPGILFFSRNRLGRENANTSSHFELPRGFPEPSRKPKINSRMVPGTTPGGPCQPEEEQSVPCQPEGEQTQVYRRVRKRTKHAPVSFRDSPNKLRVAGCSLLYRLRVSLTIESCCEPPSFLL